MRTLQFALFALWIWRANAQATTTTSGLSPAASSAALSASAAAATASTSSETSNVQGKVFNNFYQIWLENTDYDKAAAQSDLQALASQGILLTNMYAVTHPSEPNYAAVVGGDYYGIGDDALHMIPSQVATVVEILEEKGISWAEYQEDMPYSGFTGFNYTNPSNNYVDYVRKHNPLILYDSVATNASRAANIKNFTLFQSDLAAGKLPQWAFFTPNMVNDGHDSTVDVAGNWSRSFLTPLLNNTSFMNKTLVLLTFDENETYTIKNKIWAVLLGDVIPANLRGTTDNTFYTHYSCISTIQANWGLYHLGRGDVSGTYSNVLSLVANATGYTNLAVADADIPYFNFTSVGYFDTAKPGPIPAVNSTPTGAGGRGLLPALSGARGAAISPPAAASSSASGASGSASGSTASASSSAAFRQFSASSFAPYYFIVLAFAVGLVV